MRDDTESISEIQKRLLDHWASHCKLMELSDPDIAFGMSNYVMGMHDLYQQLVLANKLLPAKPEK